MTLTNAARADHSSVTDKVGRKTRSPKFKKPDAELVQLFWLAPPEAYFDQFTVAPVTGRTPKTLECDRWRGRGIPYRKCSGRVLYCKSDVIAWVQSHHLVTSTSETREQKS